MKVGMVGTKYEFLWNSVDVHFSRMGKRKLTTIFLKEKDFKQVTGFLKLKPFVSNDGVPYLRLGGGTKVIMRVRK